MKAARLIGFDQESRACAYLQQQGLTLVAKNVCFRGGELDLIMRDKETWVCVEVKFRSKSHYGSDFSLNTFSKIGFYIFNHWFAKV